MESMGTLINRDYSLPQVSSQSIFQGENTGREIAESAKFIQGM